jgi:hypothetical protein
LHARTRIYFFFTTLQGLESKKTRYFAQPKSFMKNIKALPSNACQAIIIAAVALISPHASAQVIQTDSTDLKLVTQAEYDQQTTPPDLTPNGAVAQTYTATDTAPFGNGYGPSQLFGGANGPAANLTATGQVFDIENNGTLTLTFAVPTTISAITIYDGYPDRESGSYALTAGSTDLGAYTVVNPATQYPNGGFAVSEMLFTLPTPITTSSLSLTMTNGSTESFEDIQVFGSVASAPEPGTYALMLAGLAFLLAYQYRRAHRV